MNRVIRGGRGGRLALGATLMLLLGVAIWSALAVVHLRQEQDWVQHTHKVIEAITEVEAAAYAQDDVRREQALATLHALTADNAGQGQALDRLAERARRGAVSEAARDDIRAAAGAMVHTEEDLLAARSGAQASTASTLEALIGSGLAGVLLALIGDFAIRRSEERRRHAEEERARLFDLSDELLCIATYDRRSELNPAWERLLGFTLEEIHARPMIELIHPDDRAATNASGAALLKGTSMVCFQNRLRTKDGTYRHIEWNAVAQPNREMFYATGRDISARHEHAARLETLSAELARSNRELQEFASVASHDLQEPLRKITTFGDRLKTRAISLDDESRDFVDRMQSAASRMQRLIEDLLAFARLGARPTKPEPIDLFAIAREVTVDLEARLEVSRGTLLIGELPSLQADPTQMRQLLQNLIGNALKFHKIGEPPHVQVRGRIVDRPPRVCELEVEDGGIGFDEKHLERIFSVFQRLHGRSEYDGSGMGLAICRRIVERHGGTITARSQVGEGATFIVTLPAPLPAANT